MGPLMGIPADAQGALMGKLEELKVRRRDGSGWCGAAIRARARAWRWERPRKKNTKQSSRFSLSLSLLLFFLQSVVDEVNTQFTDPERTTFVCVCIPEFLSLYETERLVQALAGFKIDCRNVCINQVIAPGAAGNSVLLAARARMQATYLAQFEELYEDFHLVRTPWLAEEVRGVEALKAFSTFLVDPAAAVAAGAALAAPVGEGALAAENAALRARVKELEGALAAAGVEK
jgi:anion-transporting  ArsA/GET3 family ATPase